MKTKRFLSFIIIAATLLLTLCFGVSAEHYNIDGYKIPVDIVINGCIIKTPVNAFLENDTTYVPVRAISEAMGAVVSWNDEVKTATVSKGENSIDFPIGEEGGAILYLDTTFIPVRAVSEKLGYEVGWDGDYYQVNITAPDITIPEEKIDYTYTNDDILLIAKVLKCECGSSTFEGKLAVANVIINRAKSDQFPDTVEEVIYDRRYGSVQFSIAYNGKLDKAEPNKECYLAAKCALDGADVATDCLFFQADYVKDSWMDKNRERAISVGGNTFFY